MLHAITYSQIKTQYENTKPIRGRSDDVRPAGKRRRDWERVVKTEQGYAYQLHGTNCVEFTETGKLIIRSGGWTTVGTGKFINDHASLVSGKRYNAIWLGVTRSEALLTSHDYKDDGGMIWVPIPAKGEITFTWDETRQKYVLDPVKIRVRTVNRKRANESRKRVKPLLDYCKAMLKLSDGEVRREDLNNRAGSVLPQVIDIPTDEHMAATFYSVLRLSKYVWSDWQRGTVKYQIPAVQRTIYKLHDQFTPEIYDHEWIDPSGKMPTNHVGYT